MTSNRFPKSMVDNSCFLQNSVLCSEFDPFMNEHHFIRKKRLDIFAQKDLLMFLHPLFECFSKLKIEKKGETMIITVTCNTEINIVHYNILHPIHDDQ